VSSMNGTQPGPGSDEDLVEVRLRYKGEREKSVKFYNSWGYDVWVPKKLLKGIDFDRSDYTKISLPRWFVESAELIQ